MSFGARFCIAAAMGLLCLTSVTKAVVPPDFAEAVVADGFQSPTDLTVSPDGRIFVAEKQGLVWIIQDGEVLATPFLDLIDVVGNAHDRGLLGIALDPNFSQNGYFYVLYAVDTEFGQPDEDASTITYGRLARYTANGNVADVNSEVILMGHGPADGFPHCHLSHAIGTVRFGPDNMLYASAGDGAHYDFVDVGQNVTTNDPNCELLFGESQDVGALRSQVDYSLAGKVVRVNPATGEGLTDNPYYDGSTTSVASRIWAMGLRNPFRFAIRPSNGAVYISDVGWTLWEELNVAAVGGENFGWPCYEGNYQQLLYNTDPIGDAFCGAMPPSAFTPPLIAWHHDEPEPIGFVGNAATGVAFYNGLTFPPQYWGACFFADYGQNWIRVAYVDAYDQLVRIDDFAENVESPVDLEVDPTTGDLLYLSIIPGEVRRIYFAADNIPPLAKAAANPSAGTAPLAVQFSSDGSFDPDGDPITFLWEFGDGTPAVTTPNPAHTYDTIGAFLARLTVSDDHTNSAQAMVLIDASNQPPVVAITNPVDGYLYTPGEIVQLAATASDVEDGSNLSYHWQLDLVHNNHVHPEVMVSDEPVPPPVQLEGHGQTDARISYVASVRVMDSLGLEGHDEIRMLPIDQPYNAAPVASFVADRVEGPAPLTVLFDGSSSADPDGDLLSYAWSFGDGAMAAGQVTAHTFEQPGSYIVTLTVTDVLGLSDNSLLVVTAFERGLFAQYYDEKDLTDLALWRVDPIIDFDWGGGSPDPQMDAQRFSVRWSGFVEPEFTETYTFYTRTDDGVRLWVEGQLLVDKWVNQAAREWSGQIALEAGHLYTIVMEYYENSGAANAQLHWSSPSQPKQFVPESRLSQWPGPPKVEVTSLSDGETVSGSSIQLAYVSRGDLREVDHVGLELDGQPAVTLPMLNGIYGLSGLPPGAHTATLTLRRADESVLANAEATLTINFMVSDPARIIILSPPDDSVVSTNVVAIQYAVDGYLADADHIHIILDGDVVKLAPLAAGAYTFTNLASGAHTLAVELNTASHTALPNPEAFDSIDVTVVLPGDPPQAHILTPAATTSWRSGQDIDFSGEAVDSGGGALPPGALSWEVFAYACDPADPANCDTQIVHVGLGIASGSMTTPSYLRPPAALEFRLTASYGGQSDRASVFIYPETVTLHVDTVPSGLELIVDGQTAPGHEHYDFIADSLVNVSAPVEQEIAGQTYHFVSWSDGGTAGHTIDVGHGVSDVELTATYEPVSAEAWSKRRKISFNNAGQTENLDGFPVLVRLDAARIDYAQTRAGGDDLRFIDPDGTVLSHEIEAWNPGGVSWIWVNVPRVDAQSTSDFMWMYYGNPSAIDGQNAPGVWSEGYVGVWHLHDTLADSTGKGHGGVNHGSDDTPGWIGGGQAFNGSSDYVEIAPAADLDFQTSDDFSIGAWAYIGASVNRWAGILSNYSIATEQVWYGIWTSPAHTWQTWTEDWQYVDGASVTPGWHYVAVVQRVAENLRTLYVDGVDQGSVAAHAGGGGRSVYLGGTQGEPNEFFPGMVDEARIAAAARSADWVRAQYLSMSDSFITVGPEESLGNQAPVASLSTDISAGAAPLAVQFDGSASYDPEGAGLVYEWDFGDGSFGSGPVVSHTYTTPGSYTATLTVRDDVAQTGETTAAIEVAGNGLRGAYYNTLDFGSFVMTRDDPQIDFQWTTGSPDPRLTGSFSIRWTGQVQPLYSETYTFYATTDDGCRLWVNGQLLVDHWQNQAATEWSGTINLTAGQRYDILLEYYEKWGWASAKLQWSSPSQAKQVIPSDRLFLPTGP